MVKTSSMCGIYNFAGLRKLHILRGFIFCGFQSSGAINGTTAIVTVPVAKSLKTYVFLWTVKRNDPALELICWLTEN